MKSLAIVLATIAVLIFAVGGYLAWTGGIAIGTYALVSGLVGSLASVVGLLTFARPRLTASDVQGVEAELLAQLAASTKAVAEYEDKISENQEQLSKLRNDRKQIELLVREASLRIFYEERARSLAAEIDKRVRRDASLVELLQDMEEANEKVRTVGGLIAESDRADLILEIVREAQRQRQTNSTKMYFSSDALGISLNMPLLASTIIRAFGKFIR